MLSRILQNCTERQIQRDCIFEKAIAINANFKDAWIDLGRVSIERGNYSDAKNYLGVANYIDENDFRYYYYQGLIAKIRE